VWTNQVLSCTCIDYSIISKTSDGISRQLVERCRNEGHEQNGQRLRERPKPLVRCNHPVSAEMTYISTPITLSMPSHHTPFWVPNMSQTTLVGDIDDSETVGHLKEAIVKKSATFANIKAGQLELRKVSGTFNFGQTMLLTLPQVVHPDHSGSQGMKWLNKSLSRPVQWMRQSHCWTFFPSQGGTCKEYPPHCHTNSVSVSAQCLWHPHLRSMPIARFNEYTVPRPFLTCLRRSGHVHRKYRRSCTSRT